MSAAGIVILVTVGGAVVLFAMAYIFSQPFREAVQNRFQGEAAIAAKKMKTVSSNLALAVEKDKANARLARKAYAKVRGRLKTIRDDLAKLEADRNRWDQAAEGWAVKGDATEVAECQAKIDDFDAQLEPLREKERELTAMARKMDQNISDFEARVQSTKARQKMLETRKDTAEAEREASRMLAGIDPDSSQALVEETEEQVREIEEEASGLSALVERKRREGDREEHLLSVGGVTADEKVVARMAKYRTGVATEAS